MQDRSKLFRCGMVKVYIASYHSPVISRAMLPQEIFVKLLDARRSFLRSF